MVSDHSPSNKQLSRRQLVTSSVVIGVAGLAGCSADTSSNSANFPTTADDYGEGGVLQQATAMQSNGSAVLLVSLQKPGTELSIESILFRDSDGGLRQEISMTDAQEYRTPVGPTPHHGRLNLIAAPRPARCWSGDRCSKGYFDVVNLIHP